MEAYLGIGSAKQRSHKRRREDLDHDADVEEDNTNHNHHAPAKKKRKKQKYAWIREQREQKLRQQKQKKNRKICQKKKKHTKPSRSITEYYRSAACANAPDDYLDTTQSSSSPSCTVDEPMHALPTKPVYTPKILHQQRKRQQENNVESIASSVSDQPNVECTDTQLPSSETQLASVFDFEEDEQEDIEMLNVHNDKYGNNKELWCEQYQPKSSTNIIGNISARKRLSKFLEAWKDSIKKSLEQEPPQRHRSKKTLHNYFDISMSRAALIKRNKNRRKSHRQTNSQHLPKHRAVLLLGPSGSGKTMTVKLLAKEYGFDTIHYCSLEFTDTERRKSIVSIFDNHKLSWYCHVAAQENQNPSWTQAERFKFNLRLRSRLIVIEDIDYLSDTANIARILKAIQNTKVPIVLIANSYNWNRGIQRIEKQNECLTLRFERIKQSDTPLIKQSINMLRDMFYDQIRMKNEFEVFIQEIIAGFYGDLRSCIGLLQFWCDTHAIAINQRLIKSQPMCLSELDAVLSMKNDTFIAGNGAWMKHQHDEVIDIFESNRRFFVNNTTQKSTYKAWQDAINWYFNCSSLTLLFVHENYLRVAHRRLQEDHRSVCIEQEMEIIANAADMICDGDLLETEVQRHQFYGTMPLIAVVSCYRASKAICQGFGGLPEENNDPWNAKAARVGFPKWFNQMRRREQMHAKLNEVNQEIIKNGKYSMESSQRLLDYLPYLSRLDKHGLVGPTHLDSKLLFM